MNPCPRSRLPIASYALAAWCALWCAWPSPAVAGELPVDWDRFAGEHVTVHAPSGHARVARSLAELGDEVVVELLALGGLDAPVTHVDAYLAPRRDTFASIQPGDPPSWAAGTAYPERGLVFVLLATHGQKTPRQVYVHELAHVVLHWVFGEADPPRWLDEGLAQVLAGEFDLRTGATLTRAAVGGQLLPLSTITRRFPDDPYRAQIAYAESRDFLLFVRHRHGDEALGTTIRELAAGASAEAALESATGESFAALEQAWLGRLKRRYGWLPVIGGSGTLWSLAAVLLVIGWVRKRRIRARKLAAMEAAEQAQQARRREAWPPDDDGPPLWREPRGVPPARGPPGNPTLH